MCPSSWESAHSSKDHSILGIWIDPSAPNGLNNITSMSIINIIEAKPRLALFFGWLNGNFFICREINMHTTII